MLGNVICHGDKNVIKEGHKSFPSGHTSCKLHCTSFVLLYCHSMNIFVLLHLLEELLGLRNSLFWQGPLLV